MCGWGECAIKIAPPIFEIFRNNEKASEAMNSFIISVVVVRQRKG